MLWIEKQLDKILLSFPQESRINKMRAIPFELLERALFHGQGNQVIIKVICIMKFLDKQKEEST